MLLLPLVSAPTVVALAGAAERRYGSRAAGWLAAFPTTLPIAILAVAAELGDQAGATLALSAAAHVGAQVAFALAFALLLRRRGALAGLAAGAAAFGALSLVIHAVPAALAAAFAVPALLAGPRLLTAPSVRREPAPRRGVRDTALASMVAVALVGTVLVAARLAGPALAGAIGAFPALSSALALLVWRETGARAAAAMLHGLIRGLPGYLAFCLVVSVVAPRAGTPAAVALAGLACVGTGALTWRTVRYGRGYGR